MIYKVPNKILILNFVQSYKQCSLPVRRPDNIVAIRGVLVQLFTPDKNLNNKPSSAIAYITRGRGNMVPRRLNENY